MCRTFAILIIITFATQVFFGNCFAFFCLFAGFVDDIPLVSGWIHSSFFFLYSPHTLSICDISRAFVEWFSVHTFVTQQVVERLMPRQILQNKWKSREVRKFCGNEVKKK